MEPGRRSRCELTRDQCAHSGLPHTVTPNRWTRAQVEALVAAGRLDDLRNRLCSRMSFGTAGLRAPMGAGFSRINDLTVIQSTQGLHSYLSRYFADFSSRGVVVGFDTRGQEESGCSSQRLATLAAAVMLSRDVPCPSVLHVRPHAVRGEDRITSCCSRHLEEDVDVF
ncbi:Glucose 1,6-bisphosphate synthase [Larimichthys crocea]|nr:Glucose 1,6-bisphosphate synthase [Larimichthys crocea]